MSPLVMESDQIPDSSITASSVVSTTEDTDVPESGDEKVVVKNWKCSRDIYAVSEALELTGS